MASISITSYPTEREPASACQGVATSSSSSPSSSQSLFSCCFDWVSPFLSRRSMESNSMESTSGATVCIPENEGTMGAFQEIAPYASTSGTSSIPIQKPCFDVFINHRGPDVKKTLATRIYDILHDMKVTAFLDSKELEYGDFLPTAIEAAIRGANLHVAIFSVHYAESPWCLEELSLMVKSGVKIVPIFYYVEPSDLRYVAQGKGKYVAAFNKHEKKCRYRPEKLQEWKRALSDVSFYSGQIIKNNGDEMRLFKNIVNIVLKEIQHVPLMVAKHPIGLNEAVEDFENTLELVSGDEGVQIVGIWGMGGSGKTTLAKELYNRRSSSMERSCFIFDIREAKGVLQKKQSELLKGLGVNEPVANIEQGKAILARLLRSFRVLIVMDDVDHVDQLDALLPVKDSLERGSLIIITTRECEVLTSWGIHSIYKMKALDPINAEQLFCWHAFLHPSPLPGFVKLVNKFVEACDGLPLSLKVFGGQLYARSNKKYWESLFHKISRILSNDIKEKLKVSYDALDDEEKEAFLDTACFFIREQSSLAIEVWDGSGWSGLYTWERLLNKCLVEVDDDNRVRMHDHLRDLGRDIASQHSPSRYWLSQQIINSGKQIEKTNCIRGIKNAWTRREERLSNEEHLSGGILFLRPSLVGLKLLVIEGDYFNQIIDEAPRELLWLRLYDIRQRNLRAPLSLKNLRVLELYYGQNSFEELWEAESDAPVQLRELSIDGCHKLRRFPNSIGCLNVLKKMVIRFCTNIESLPEEFCRLQLLEHLELCGCEKLSSLPSSFGDLTNLRYLDLSWCSKLRELPVSFKKLILLQSISLHGCEELMLRSDDFQNITKLVFLNLSGCEQLEELPRDVTNQVYLRELHLDGAKRLRELPIQIGELSRLRKMKIGSELLIGFPNSLGDLSSLTHLIISCPSVESLPTSLGNLSSLTD
ncbi:disease resistance protein Roq1, partial [Cryptomeria japonica]|uniref:disease resistance protein Roq1 n=1 Tax=Cryptomeria japonica TaxID=3369 RepID=UPI0027DA45F6